MASSLCEHEIQQHIRMGQAHLGYPPPQASIPDWLTACSQEFSLQAQLLGGVEFEQHNMGPRPRSRLTKT